MKTFFLALVALIAVGITAVAAAVYFGMEQATVPVAEGYGPNPTLPEPNPSLVPTVNIAPATVWPAGATPIAASGMTVNEFAGGFNVMSHYTWSKNIDYDGTYYPRDAKLARGVSNNNRRHVFFFASLTT